ncbi:hypothetical protein ACQ859_21240 [Roseateles chitinivorans]|uniref:hypothetical protein n=1 Tax=Roseateles chitinivorans TaxID=2917965 RepID=UPI003D678624
MNKPKPPLYRKENTTAHTMRDRHRARDFGDTRNTKAEQMSDATRRPMHGKEQRGRDYTPLYRFLLSKVGQPWSEVHSEAVGRLDRPDPIFWMVALHEDDRKDYVCTGESSHFSGLYVDEAGLLQLVNPDVGPSTLAPTCRCCTHTFNGVPFTKTYRYPGD